MSEVEFRASVGLNLAPIPLTLHPMVFLALALLKNLVLALFLGYAGLVDVSLEFPERIAEVLFLGTLSLGLHDEPARLGRVLWPKLHQSLLYTFGQPIGRT